MTTLLADGHLNSLMRACAGYTAHRLTPPDRGADLQRFLPFCLCLASALCGAEELRWGY